MTMSGASRLSHRTPSAAAGTPNAAIARQTSATFDGERSIQMSLSPVARGTPWTASACAPTARNPIKGSESMVVADQFRGSWLNDSDPLIADPLIPKWPMAAGPRSR